MKGRSGARDGAPAASRAADQQVRTQGSNSQRRHVTSNMPRSCSVVALAGPGGMLMHVHVGLGCTWQLCMRRRTAGRAPARRHQRGCSVLFG